MDVLKLMCERNMIHAILPLKTGDERAEAEQQIAKLDSAIAQIEALEKAHEAAGPLASFGRR